MEWNGRGGERNEKGKRRKGKDDREGICMPDQASHSPGSRRQTHCLQDAALPARSHVCSLMSNCLQNVCTHSSKSNQIKSNMTLIMVDEPQPSYNLLTVMK